MINEISMTMERNGTGPVSVQSGEELQGMEPKEIVAGIFKRVSPPARKYKVLMLSTVVT